MALRTMPGVIASVRWMMSDCGMPATARRMRSRRASEPSSVDPLRWKEIALTVSLTRSFHGT